MIRRSNIYQNIDLSTFEIEIPIFQRTLNLEHVDRIYNKATEYLKFGNDIPFPLISVAYYPILIGGVSTYKFYIIDGQHRYEAYKRLKNNGYIFILDIQVITCGSVEEAEVLYRLYNERMEHSNIELYNHGIQNDLDRQILIYLYSNENLFSINLQCKRPKIKTNIFYDKWIKSNIRKNIKNITEFEQWLFDTNIKFRSQLNFMTMVEFARLEITESLLNKANSINWFLGLDKTLSWLV